MNRRLLFLVLTLSLGLAGWSSVLLLALDHPAPAAAPLPSQPVKDCPGIAPHVTDPATLLLLHFDGTITGTQGEIGYLKDPVFSSGCFDQGIVITGSDTLTYTTAGNFDPAAGSIDLWANPYWPGDDGEVHIFFETGPSVNGGVQVGKDENGNLQLVIWGVHFSSAAVADVLTWQPGEWHRITAWWQGQQMALLVDGRSPVWAAIIDPPPAVGTTLHVGHAPYLGWQAEAVLDELRIRGRPWAQSHFPVIFAP